MIDFSTLQGVTIPEGALTQIESGGVVLWKLETSKPIVLEVEKITSDTYAGETTYTGENFILLDIYPKTNGTVKVTYGGLTKTITDTSGVESPNAQQVVFGTFNGVTHDSSPTSGTLTIEGDCFAFGVGTFKQLIGSKASTQYYTGITKVTDTEIVEVFPNNAFCRCKNLTSVVVGSSVVKIASNAFASCDSLESVIFVEQNGWYSALTESATSGSALDVSDPASNAAKLVETHNSTWKRS